MLREGEMLGVVDELGEWMKMNVVVVLIGVWVIVGRVDGRVKMEVGVGDVFRGGRGVVIVERVGVV